MTDSVLFDVQDGLARVTLNRPEASNAVDLPTAVAFGAAVDRAAADRDQFCLKNISFVTCFAASPWALDRASLLLLSGDGIAARPMISGIAALDDWQEVFVQSRAGEGLKYMFDPSL